MAYCYLCDREIDGEAKGDGEGEQEYFKPNNEGAFAWAHRWCRQLKDQVKGDQQIAVARALIKVYFDEETMPEAIAKQEKVF